MQLVLLGNSEALMSNKTVQHLNDKPSGICLQSTIIYNGSCSLNKLSRQCKLQAINKIFALCQELDL